VTSYSSSGTRPASPGGFRSRVARALHSPVLADPRRPANTTRFVSLDPAAREFFVDSTGSPLGTAAAIGLVSYFVGALIGHLRVRDTKGAAAAVAPSYSRSPSWCSGS
jgi:hypothetical protein